MPLFVRMVLMALLAMQQVPVAHYRFTRTLAAEPRTPTTRLLAANCVLFQA